MFKEMIVLQCITYMEYFGQSSNIMTEDLPEIIVVENGVVFKHRYRNEKPFSNIYTHSVC